MQTSGVFRLQEMKRERQNEQMKIYLFVLIMYLLIFWIGLLGCSLFWVFVIAFATFSLWKRKVFSLTERYIKEKETILHRKKALRQSETCEWLNFIVNRWLEANVYALYFIKTIILHLNKTLVLLNILTL